MSYRGFTWNLTYSEYANVARILEEHMRCESCYKWDYAIAQSLLRKITYVMDVSPDGTSPTHGPADA